VHLHLHRSWRRRVPVTHRVRPHRSRTYAYGSVCI
jgi:hypothetical protein